MDKERDRKIKKDGGTNLPALDGGTNLPAYVLSGRLDDIPPPMKKVVKIFLSSTFTDMKIERNYLFSNIYQKLQQYCQSKNLEFQVVDMRWGVREELTSLDHSASKICMDELSSCQELSLGPNFVCLLGQRYGSCPLQAEITKTEFDCIVEALEAMTEEERKSAEVDIELLKEWYQCDENGEPPTMILSPLNERGEEMTPDNFASDVQPHLYRTLAAGSTKAVKNKKMADEVSKKYHWSVTEEEVYRGILSQENARDHTLCFQRQLGNEKDIDYNNDKRFFETDDNVKQKLEVLVQKTKDKLGEENCRKVSWSAIKCANNKELNITDTEKEELDDYLEQFGKSFEERVKGLIDKALLEGDPLEEALQKTSPHKYSDKDMVTLLTEVADHAYQAKAKIERFQEREEILRKLRGYVKSRSCEPFIIHGESGFGKTSLLAVASKKLFEWCGDTNNIVVIRRFLGTTPDSTNVTSLLASVTKQLSLACGFSLPSVTDPSEILSSTLKCVPKYYKVFVFLDSLDQLSSYGKAHKLAWLPTKLPSNVKLVVSTLPKEHGLLELLKQRRYTFEQFTEVGIIGEDLAMKLIQDWMKKQNRKLSKEQLQVVRTRFKEDENTSPLYVKLIFDVVVKLRSYFRVKEFEDLLSNTNSPKACVEHIFEQLMIQNGSLLVHRIFAYLHLSNLGLTENELVDLISLDDEVLNDVVQFHELPIRRLPVVLWARIRNTIKDYLVTRESYGGKVIAWYHRKFIEIGDVVFTESLPTKYQLPSKIPNVNALCNLLRENMVDYFTGKWSGEKKKPFKHTDKIVKKRKLKAAEDAKIRMVPKMGNMLENGRPNLRKLGQLPNLLIKLGRIEEFFTEVFGNIEGLVGLFSMYSWSDIYEIVDGINFDSYEAIGTGNDDQQGQGQASVADIFHIMLRTLLLTSTVAKEYPRMLGPLVIGRLLPFAAGSKILNDFISGVYEKGPKLNSFVCPHVHLEGVGNYLLFEMPNHHIGACVAMIEVTPRHHHYVFTVSKVAVLINADDGNIQMRYIPPDLRKDDRFNLVAAADPFGDPKEVAASLKIVPKIYIFSLIEFKLRNIIDCGKYSGGIYSNMQIEAIQLEEISIEGGTVTTLLVHGSASHGLLLFDLHKKNLLCKFKNDEKILFTRLSFKTVKVVQPSKETILDIKQAKADEWKFSKKSTQSLKFPADSAVTTKACKGEWLSFATDFGHVYVGNGCSYYTAESRHTVWIEAVLDTPALDLQFSQHTENDEMTLGICTESHCYIAKVYVEELQQYNKDEVVLELCPVLLVQMERTLSKLCVVDNEICIGYHLGKLYIFNMDSNDEKNVEIRLVREVDAHAQPITGLIANKDIATMVLTSAEDGIVRMFNTGRTVHKDLQKVYSFHKMGVPIHKISASPCFSASLSTHSNSVAVWSNSAGKITKQLAHEDLSDGDTLTDVVCFDDAVVTVTVCGMISFWDISQSEPKLVKQINLKNFQQMTRGCAPYEVLLTCTNGWHKFNSKSGEMMSEMMYEDREILKVQYVKSQLSLLQRLLEEEELVVEVITEDGNATTINLSTDKDLDCGKLQDFFCCDHLLVLLYPRKCIFYNWNKREVLQEEELDNPTLISSQSNAFILRSNCNILSYKVNQRLEKLNTEPLKLAHNDDQIIMSPDGRHVIVVEQKKMLSMYRVGDLTARIGQYSLYGELESVVIASDGSYIVCGIADTRLFYLMLCDVEVEGHQERALKLGREVFTKKEKHDSVSWIEAAGLQGDVEDEFHRNDDSDNLNQFISDYSSNLNWRDTERHNPSRGAFIQKTKQVLRNSRGCKLL